ncbi:TPA: hypothetical protein HA241_06545 [Candidatus Woesearchaeota archaeon]|nr:hypothetical protein [Candidatus Woesearchaeota archaeon]
MARYLEEIEDNIDLKDFENAAVRLIGGEPNPNRSVIFVDYAISSGTTLGCCALDFQRLGYDTEKMYFTQGHEIDPLKNWIGELSHLESCFGRFDITPEQWKEYHEQLQAVLRKQGLAD